MTLLEVKCRHFEETLNCSAPLPRDVKDACCDTEAPQRSRQYYFSTLMKCCEVLEDNGYAAPNNPDWENGSYQAYVMGVAVFAILICLFVSGARSVRRRRLLLRARQAQLAQGTEGGAGHLPEINTQISLGPPTYGELEASGLTKDYKLGALDPPAYPGIPEEEEYIECVVPPGGQNEREDDQKNKEKQFDSGIGESSAQVEPIAAPAEDPAATTGAMATSPAQTPPGDNVG